MISMQYMQPRNISLLREDFPPSVFKTQSTPRRNSIGVQDIANMKKGTQKPSFPEMVFQILEDSEKEGTEEIVGWEGDGKSFHISQPNEFNNTILPKYSGKKTLYRSFQRQLNIYGFKVTKQSGVYYHALFRRDAPQEMSRIRPRTQTKRDATESKKRRYKATQSPDTSDDEEATIVTNSSRTYHTRPSRSTSLDDELSLSTGSNTNERTVLAHFDSPICVATTGPTNNISSTLDIGGGSDFDLFDDNLEGIHYCNCNGCGCCFSSPL